MKKTPQTSRPTAKNQNRLRMTTPLTHHCLCSSFCRLSKGAATRLELAHPHQSPLCFTWTPKTRFINAPRIRARRRNPSGKRDEPQAYPDPSPHCLCGARQTIRLSWFQKSATQAGANPRLWPFTEAGCVRFVSVQKTSGVQPRRATNSRWIPDVVIIRKSLTNVK